MLFVVVMLTGFILISKPFTGVWFLHPVPPTAAILPERAGFVFPDDEPAPANPPPIPAEMLPPRILAA